MSNELKPWYVRYSIPIAIGCITLVWTAVVLASGAKINLTGVEWDFSRTALLGDSFGVVGSIMATMAAVFTFIALDDQRNEVRRLRRREDDRDKSDREREAEATFFRLLELRNSIVANITHYTGSPSGRIESNGQQAILKYSKIIQPSSTDSVEQSKERCNKKWYLVEGEMGHYLRLTYHIIKFVSERFDNEFKRYEYVRLLRAQLSNAELKIIAVNSAYGEGAPKMKDYVNKYAILHSLPNEAIDGMKLRNEFSSSAFDSSDWAKLTEARNGSVTALKIND